MRLLFRDFGISLFPTLLLGLELLLFLSLSLSLLLFLFLFLLLLYFEEQEQGKEQGQEKEQFKFKLKGWGPNIELQESIIYTQARMTSTIHDMFASIAPRYDLANDVLSLGMHRLWRRAVSNRAAQALSRSAVSRQAHPPRALDLCTGTGDLAFAIRSASLPNSPVVFGLDFVREMVDLAQQKKALHTDNPAVHFLNGDATAIPFPDHSMDLVTISFGIRNIPDITACLQEITRVLTPSGTLIILEFGQVRLPIFRECYNWYCRAIMPQIGRVLTGNRSAYEYLPETSLRFPAGSAFLEILSKNDFRECQAKPLLAGLAYIYTAVNQGSLPASLGKSAVLG